LNFNFLICISISITTKYKKVFKYKTIINNLKDININDFFSRSLLTLFCDQNFIKIFSIDINGIFLIDID